MIDSVLSHYRLIERLGEGGMGEIYLARDERLEREVAIKRLRPELLADPAARERFRTEALALSRLNHPGIAIVYDVGREGDADYLVMERVPGEPLAHRIAKGALAESEVVELGAQIADALAAAHAGGVVHRDLKPDNVMVTPEGRVKVLDFGLALLTLRDAEVSRAATVPLAGVGTLAYMAPEQVSGGAVDHRTDLYALGAILYEMATGARPHSGDSLGALVYAIVHQPPLPPRSLRPEISAELEALVLAALEKDQDRRPASAAQMAASLRSHTAPALPRAERSIRSLVVLPLVNRSGDPAEEFFADGMTEALIGGLAGIAALRVISRTTAMRYKDSPLALAEIARELNVDGVIEGSVQRAGARVRIGVQLVEAAADRLVWARSYEGEFTDVLGLEAQVARSVAAEMRIALSPREAARLAGHAVAPRAYEAYLHGRFHWNRRSEPEMRRGIDFFEQAIALDPGYALPYVGLADSYNLLGDMNAVLPHEAAARAKGAVARALELDPELGEAHTSLGFLHMYYDWDWRAARREFERALELNPGYPTGHQWYAEFLAASGAPDAAIAAAQRARELDPKAPILGTTLGDVHFYARRYDEAIVWLERALELDATFYQAMNDIGRVYSETGRYDEALVMFERAHALSGSNPLASVGRGYTLARAGRAREAREILAHLEAEAARRYVSPHALAAILIGLGERERALDMLERAFRERDRALVWIRVHPRLDPLRGEARFREIERQVMTRE